jgi:hypothetical protein
LPPTHSRESKVTRLVFHMFDTTTRISQHLECGKPPTAQLTRVILE